MVRHEDIWRAIDRIAAERGISPSRLAREAGLDPTTFNKSKRFTRNRKARWPTTESIAKVLAAAGKTLAEFSALVDERGGGGARSLHVIGFAQAGEGGYFDDAGYPTHAGWDKTVFPGLGDPHAYALHISGDSMEPAYRDGDLVVVSPQAPIRAGDRVVVKTRAGEVMAKVLVRKTRDVYEFGSLNPDHPNRLLATGDVAWVSRILWASQ